MLKNLFTSANFCTKVTEVRKVFYVKFTKGVRQNSVVAREASLCGLKWFLAKTLRKSLRDSAPLREKMETEICLAPRSKLHKQPILTKFAEDIK